MIRFINPSYLQTFFPWILWKSSADKREVFLTFDDGPHPEFTRTVLDILAKYQIKASFFVTGEKAVLFPSLIRRILQEGHTIGNHGYHHTGLWFKKIKIIMEEINRTDLILEKIINKKSTFFRPPFGKFDCRFQKIMLKTQHKLILWSLMAYDFQDQDCDKIVKRIEKHIHPGAILVLHDGHIHSNIMIPALSPILESLRDKEYRCLPLDDIKDS